MWNDPSVEETRAVRDAYAAQYNFDLDAIYQALKEQKQHGERKLVTLASKQPPQTVTQIKTAA
jgi:hypothetical protein